MALHITQNTNQNVYLMATRKRKKVEKQQQFVGYT